MLACLRFAQKHPRNLSPECVRKWEGAVWKPYKQGFVHAVSSNYLRKPRNLQCRMGLNLNLLDQLSFYGAYHNNKWNQLIHFVFVPTIVWTLLVWLSYSGSLVPDAAYSTLDVVPEALREYIIFNAAFFLVLIYSSLYVALDFIAGLTWSMFVGVPLWLTATAFQLQMPNAWAWAIPIHIFAWYMQIHPGHAVLEKRKPALLDSLVQAFALAPLFVWFELLFMLGYRKDLYQQLQARVSASIAEYHKQRQALLSAK